MDIPHGGVGFFDSGIGGLTVLSSCLKNCEGLPVYYYGDDGRAPYGNLPPETIFKYAGEAFDLFEALEARAVVIACNTVTAVCADEFRRRYSFPVIGAEPAVFPAAQKGGEIFVLATRATVESARFRRLRMRAAEKYPTADIRPFSCDGLAGAVERRFFSDGEKNSDNDFDFSSFFPAGRPAAVVLGCTHYIFLKERITRFYGCPVYDGNEGIACRLACVLAEKSPPGGERRPPKTTFSDLSPLVTTLRPPLPFRQSVFENQKREEVFERDTEGILSQNLSKPEANTCSDVFFEKQVKLPEKSGFLSIFFLGSGKMTDKRVYEQMFVLNSGMIFKNWG